MTRQLSVHPSRYCRLTDHAQQICILLNQYKRHFPEARFSEMRNWFNDNHYAKFCPVPLSYTSIRRYYYGMHEVNGQWDYHLGETYAQVRKGICVPIAAE